MCCSPENVGGPKGDLGSNNSNLKGWPSITEKRGLWRENVY